MHARKWNISIHLTEDGPQTVAHAVLRTDAGTEIRHQGRAHRNPHDRDVAEIGDELAVSRALLGLAQDLFDATVGDIEQNTGEDVRMTFSP